MTLMRVTRDHVSAIYLYGTGWLPGHGHITTFQQHTECAAAISPVDGFTLPCPQIEPNASTIG